MNTEEPGYVYILTNPSFPKDCVKIGKTSRSVEVRVKELDNTSVPQPFEIYATMKTKQYSDVEKEVHKIIDTLTDYRVRREREFFYVSPEKALEIFRTIAKHIDDAEVIVYQNNQSIDPTKKTSKGKRVVRPRSNKSSNNNTKKGENAIINDKPIPEIFRDNPATVTTEKGNNEQKGKKQDLDKSLNGVEFSKDKKILIRVPEDKKGPFIIPDYVTEIGDCAFFGCASLTSIELPDGVTKIEAYAFRGCTSLASIEIPDSVTKIGRWAFCGCTSLTSIEIPDSATEIGEGAFAYCTGLKEIIVDDKNPNYCSKDGVLYSKDMLILIVMVYGSHLVQWCCGLVFLILDLIMD